MLYHPKFSTMYNMYIYIDICEYMQVINEIDKDRFLFISIHAFNFKISPMSRKSNHSHRHGHS